MQVRDRKAECEVMDSQFEWLQYSKTTDKWEIKTEIINIWATAVVL